MLVPIADLKASLEVFHSEAEIYPIWLCPFKLPARPGMLKVASNKEEMFVDVGVYGVPKNERFVEIVLEFDFLIINMDFPGLMLRRPPERWKSS